MCDKNFWRMLRVSITFFAHTQQPVLPGRVCYTAIGPAPGRFCYTAACAATAPGCVCYRAACLGPRCVCYTRTAACLCWPGGVWPTAACAAPRTVCRQEPMLHLYMCFCTAP
jgi:hypothetical protein